MKEIDVIKHAKSYMEMLSQGINPITKVKYAKDSDINNERLLKCFEFVSGVLEKVISEEELKADEAQFKNTLVSDEIEGRDVVDVLIKKGVLKQGLGKEDIRK